MKNLKKVNSEWIVVNGSYRAPSAHQYGPLTTHHSLLTNKKAAFTLAEGATHVETCNNNRKAAFTLAEVLITLGVIGVVAAVAMPTMITNMTERKNSERHANIAYKITQAMEHMRATGTLVQYPTTEAFVNELSKHLKIAKVCDKDHLTECWPTEKVLDKNGEEFEVKNAKTGKNLNLGTTTNNVGIILADGAPLILNYDNTSKGFDIGDRIEAKTTHKYLPVGGGKTKGFAYTTNVTSAIDFVTDVNGKGKPNREMDTNNKYYDIRQFKAASFTKGCAGEEGSAGCLLLLSSYDPVDCSDSSSDDYEYCKPHPSGLSNDYWAGAKRACVQKGMKLPDEGELKTIQQKKSEYPSLKDNTGLFRSDTESFLNTQNYAMSVYFDDGASSYTKFKNVQLSVVCSAD